ncbi:MAG: hypothetical protein FJZ63_06305 [Chlamydiae bacterium]|nr:hypothetical protein [Chlamydiota bacterium]
MKLYGVRILRILQWRNSLKSLLKAKKFIGKTFQIYPVNDALADAFGYPKTGLPHGAGYAVGYHLVKDYLAKTGKDIFIASAETSKQILGQETAPSGAS